MNNFKFKKKFKLKIKQSYENVIKYVMFRENIVTNYENFLHIYSLLKSMQKFYLPLIYFHISVTRFFIMFFWYSTFQNIPVLIY